MSNFTFRPAKRENVGLMIGLAGGTGSGKTFSALRLASGIAGEQRFGLIDTEAGRAKHYADQFDFDHGDLVPPFRPSAYIEAIQVADKAGYPVIVVDSFSHVWAGDGGVLDWQEEELDRMAGDDWRKREACRMASWIKPKMGHKAMIQKLLQIRAHLIFCLRAEEKIEMKKNAKGKMEIVPKEGPTGLNGWMPICEKNFPFELTASFLLTADKPGILHPIKLQEQHRDLFPTGKHIDEDAGKRITKWASGGTPRKKKESTPNGEYVNAAQMKRLGELAKKFQLDAEQMKSLCSTSFGRKVSGAKDVQQSEYATLVMNFDRVSAGEAELRKDPPRFEFPPE